MTNKPWAIVTGGAGTLGGLIAAKLQASHEVIIWDQGFAGNSDLLRNVDVSSYRQVYAAASSLPADCSHIDVLVNCAGINKLNWLENVDEFRLNHHMGVNAFGIINTVQALLPKMKAVARLHPSGGTVCNIVSNASHVPMRASIAYNASKAAAAMITKQMARELGDRHGLTVFAVSPNVLADTNMTKDVTRQVSDVRGVDHDTATMMMYQGTAIGRMTPPERVAEFVAWLLADKERHRYLHGCDIPYGA